MEVGQTLRIFTITVGIGKDFKDCRTMGFYYEKDVAINAVLQNVCDIAECCYEYCVVEEVSAGIHPTVFNRWFFVHDYKRHEWKPIEEPKELKHYCNFSMG